MKLKRPQSMRRVEERKQSYAALGCRRGSKKA